MCRLYAVAARDRCPFIPAVSAPFNDKVSPAPNHENRRPILRRGFDWKPRVTHFVLTFGERAGLPTGGALSELWPKGDTMAVQGDALLRS